MIDFTLSPAQHQTRADAIAFATLLLAPARHSYAKLPPSQRFASTRPILEKATSLGLIRSQIPPALGGTGGSLIDVCLVVEELYAVEPSIALTLLSNALGLATLVAGGTGEQHKEFLEPFLSGEGAPLASLVYSEPEGSANFFEKGGEGMRTMAKREGDEWVLNGEKVCIRFLPGAPALPLVEGDGCPQDFEADGVPNKIWATNCAGWDDGGADLQCVVCRDSSVTGDDPEAAAMILLVTRALIDAHPPTAYTVLAHPTMPGHTACSGPHVKFTDLRIPTSHVLAAPGTGATSKLITGAFTMTAAIVGAMSVGIMRKTFDSALHFTKAEKRGGSMQLLERQSVADVLIDIKMRAEAARYLTWKAAQSVELGVGHGELAFEAKIWCSEAAVRSVADAMRVVGISSYSTDYPLAELMADALVLPIFDGGNIGVRRRQVQQVFMREDYQPWKAAFGDQPQA